MLRAKIMKNTKMAKADPSKADVFFWAFFSSGNMMVFLFKVNYISRLS